VVNADKAMKLRFRDPIAGVFIVVIEYLLFLIEETIMQIGPDQAWL
jgi:hypothetical protein